MDRTQQRNIPNDPDLLPAARELLAQHPSYQQSGALEIAEDLFWLRYTSYRPHEAAVEATLEPLAVDGELLP